VLRFRALASGSSGNAYLLRTDKVSLLFDAGLRWSTLRRFLLAEGIAPDGVSGVLISHEHRDHCGCVRDIAEQHGTTVWANPGVLRAAGLASLNSARVMETGTTTIFGDVAVTTFPVEHDAVDPVGFLIHVAGKSIAIATDLGRPSGPVARAVAEADLVVLESNHDAEMLHQGRYPYHLRRRVAGPTGHLSNAQAASILAENIRPRRGVEVWLAHLSKENNRPFLAIQTTRTDLKRAGKSEVRVDVALRDRPSLVWNGSTRPMQLSLFPGEAP